MPHDRFPPVRVGWAPGMVNLAGRADRSRATTAQYWLNLQNAVDLYDAQQRLAASGTRPQLMPDFAHPS